MAEDVTLIIAGLGGLERLHPCLESVFNAVSGAISFRVIVGFNFDGESEAPRVLAREFPHVEQLRAPVRLGYCRPWPQGKRLRRDGAEHAHSWALLSPAHVRCADQLSLSAMARGHDRVGAIS
jgi:hypothetical protein